LKDRQFLREVAESLGFDKAAMLQVCAEVRGSGVWSAAMRGNSAQSKRPDITHAPSPSMANAYNLLGVSVDTSPEEVRRAYHRQMAQHHPDKLASQNPSPEALRRAHLKAHEIREAFEAVRQVNRARA
jgi:DnaJ like chaperone protein